MIEPRTLARVVISPKTVSLNPGQQSVFVAYGRMSNNDSVSVPATFSGTGGSVTSGGTYTAGITAGAFRVIATSSSFADTAGVTISPPLPPTLVRVILSPDTATVNQGLTKQFSTTGKYSDSSTATITPAYSSTGGTITPGGLYTAGTTPGTYKVFASSQGKADTSTVTIPAAPPPTLVRIMLTPDTATVNQGQTKQFTTTGKYSDSSTAPVTPTYTATGGTISAGGLYTAGTSAGTFKVLASTQGKADTSTVTIPVAAPTLVRIILAPDTATVIQGQTKQFSTTGKYSDSSTAPITPAYTATGGTISAGGLYTAGLTAGTFKVFAAFQTKADTSTVTIPAAPPPTLVRIMLTPDTATVNQGQTKQFATTGKYSDSSTAPIAPTYTATGGTISAGGLYTAGATAGTFKVFAAFQTKADTSTVTIPALSTAECATPQAGWIWCDDFEQDRLSSYFEYDNPGGNFVRASGVGKDGSVGMRGHFTAGASSAGDLHLAFGRTPSSYIRPIDAGTADYREIYWRMYVRTQAGWIGGAHDKLSRGLIFGTPNFAEAIAAHVWGGDVPDTNRLILDPASGVNASGILVTTGYNDPNLVYLGQTKTTTPLFDAAHVGNWYCVEAHVKLNTLGQSDGVFELWINNTLEAQRSGMNWVSAYSAFGINAVYFENYWNNGSPVAQDRFFDNIVVSTQRIGC